jgi:hypothetical protein
LSVYFIIDSVQKLLDTPFYYLCAVPVDRGIFLNILIYIHCVEIYGKKSELLIEENVMGALTYREAI